MVSSRQIIYKVILYTVIAIGAGLLIFPFIWMVSCSLKTYANIFRVPPRLIPDPTKWSNYLEAWTVYPFARFFMNSLLVASLCAFGDTFTSSLVAFGFARLRCRASNPLFALVLVTMMIPYELIIIPQFMIFKTLRLVNTLVPLWILTFFAWPYFVFLFRQYFMTIPLEFDDAARIDGCSKFRIYWNIILPLSKPFLAAVALFSFVGNWQLFLAPLIYITSQEKYTLTLGIYLLHTRNVIKVPLIMAVSAGMVVVPVVIFSIASKYFIREITLSTYK